MKHYLAAGGALLLGTSTVAMAADAMKTPSQGGVEATKVTDAAAVQKSATAATLHRPSAPRMTRSAYHTAQRHTSAPSAR